ncbi:MAG: hypothetical protein PHD43_15480 [Methylococcales bacterium]|nr:hypothetical protein [Methylococcales bacterium]
MKQDNVFEEFLKELPAEYHKMAYEFKAFTRSRNFKTPAQLLQNPSALLRILVVDGSSLQGPGAKGTGYRLHLASDLR